MTGARCSSSAMTAICSTPTAGGVPTGPALPARLSARESFPWMLEKLRAGELVCLSSPDELPDGVDRASLLRFDMKSTVAVPLSVARRIVGVVIFAVTRRERRWPPEMLQRLRLVASLFASVLARRHSDEALRRALAEVKRLSDQLHAENVYLRREVGEHARDVGRRRAERRDSPGAGAGRAGGSVSDASVIRRHGPVRLRQGNGRPRRSTPRAAARRARASRSIAAQSRAKLIEFELFGHEKGSFTCPLMPQHRGRFEEADGGHPLPGRNRRHAARHAGEIAARAGGSRRVHPRRRHAARCWSTCASFLLSTAASTPAIDEQKNSARICSIASPSSRSKPAEPGRAARRRAPAG